MKKPTAKADKRATIHRDGTVSYFDYTGWVRFPVDEVDFTFLSDSDRRLVRDYASRHKKDTKELTAIWDCQARIARWQRRIQNDYEELAMVKRELADLVANMQSAQKGQEPATSCVDSTAENH